MRPGHKLIALNLLWCVLVLAGVVGVAELYLRATTPFTQNIRSVELHPQAGYIFTPHSEVQATNFLDFWTRQNANRFGFLDREPQPRGGCHLVMIGDSFIEASQVKIADKVQVRLEESAGRELPHLGLTVSAFGQSDTGQANQLPYYDVFARAQTPDVVVLTFVSNDFSNNSRRLSALAHGSDPDHMPRHYVDYDADQRAIEFPVDPEWAQHVLPRPADPDPQTATPPLTLHEPLMQNSLAYQWLFRKIQRQAPALAGWIGGRSGPSEDRMTFFARILAQRPDFRTLFQDWSPESQPDVDAPFAADVMPAGFVHEMEMTAAALDLWVQRAKRDRFHLLVLSSTSMKPDTGPSPLFDRMQALLTARDIPLIDQSAFILKHGGRIRDARFRHDGHWSPQGHLWAAEAVAAYLKDHQDMCHSR